MGPPPPNLLLSWTMKSAAPGSGLMEANVWNILSSRCLCAVPPPAIYVLFLLWESFLISLTTSAGSLHVEAFHVSLWCEPSSRAYSLQCEFKQRQKGLLRECWCCSSKGNEVVWTAVWRQCSVGSITEEWRNARGRPPFWDFRSKCDECICVLKQHCCKSKHSVAEKVVNMFWGLSGLKSWIEEREEKSEWKAQACSVILPLLVFIIVHKNLQFMIHLQHHIQSRKPCHPTVLRNNMDLFYSGVPIHGGCVGSNRL